jgi:hypothetical protein
MCDSRRVRRYRVEVSVVKIEQWDEGRDGPLTEDEIRRRHQPATAYRTSRRTHPRGASVALSGRLKEPA